VVFKQPKGGRVSIAEKSHLEYGILTQIKAAQRGPADYIPNFEFSF
jgi:hypothetical protein